MAAAWSARCWRIRTMRPWPAPSAPMASGSRTRPTSRRHWSGRWRNAPALIDVVTSQAVVSSDAKKGLGFVPDYQPLTAWDEAERRRRGVS